MNRSIIFPMQIADFRVGQVPRPAWCAVLCLLCLLVPGSVQASAPAQAPRCDWSQQSYDDFWETPPLGDPGPERLGELLRVEHVDSYTRAQVFLRSGVVSPYGAELYRVLYLSQFPMGSYRAVSGILAIPTGLLPGRTSPGVLYGNGTVGIADQCAPSRDVAFHDAFLLPYIAQGLAVLASDAIGLGTAGLHPYGVGEAAAVGMLDAGRALLNFCDEGRGIGQLVTNDLFIVGHSQGGHSALFAHQYHRSYAPELNVLGTVAFAPGAEPRFLVHQMAKRALSTRIAPLTMAMYALQQTYGRPDSLADWLQPSVAQQVPELVNTQCVGDLALSLKFQVENVFQPRLLAAAQDERWDELEPWTSLLDQNTPGNYQDDRPVLILHGQKDETVPFGAGQLVTQRLCAQGTPTVLSRYPAAGHYNIQVSGRKEADQWMEDRLLGLVPPNECGPAPDPLADRVVVLAGRDLPAYDRTPVDALVAYRYDPAMGWQAISLQVDERNGEGTYVIQEDGFLDDNDEVVVRITDLGRDPVAGEALPGSALGASLPWYRIQVTATGEISTTGSLYLFRDLPRPRGDRQGALTYDPVSRLLLGSGYQVGFSADGRTIESLALQDGANLLDGFKDYACPTVAQCAAPVPFALASSSQGLVVGPLRGILGHGELVAYPGHFLVTLPTAGTGESPARKRYALDLLPDVVGSAMTHGGLNRQVIVDGIPDTMEGSGSSPWWQLTTESGTLLTVLRGQTPLANTFWDDAAQIDSGDLGDMRHYGEFGYEVEKSALPVTLAFYGFEGIRSDLAAFAQDLDRPVQVRVLVEQAAPERRLYLPRIVY